MFEVFTDELFCMDAASSLVECLPLRGPGVRHLSLSAVLGNVPSLSVRRWCVPPMALGSQDIGEFAVKADLSFRGCGVWVILLPLPRCLLPGIEYRQGRYTIFASISSSPGRRGIDDRIGTDTCFDQYDNTLPVQYSTGYLLD